MPSDDDAADRPTMAPFLGSLAIIVIVLIAIWLLNLFEGDRTPEEQKVRRAAVGQNDALQRENFTDFSAYTCKKLQGSESDMTAHQRDSKDKRGARFIDDVTDVKINGDGATATVTYHFDRTPDAKTPVPMTFAREDGAWKVCSTGPS